MSKTKVVLASILKPVDDSRSYEKIGYSLSQTKKYDVNIIGFRAKNIGHVIAGINMLPVFNFSRLNFKRILAPLICFRYYLRIRPRLILFNTHELIIVSILYKLLFRVALCYDVRENYYRNIKYGSSFPPLLRSLVAAYVRAKEYLSRPFIDHYFIAEINYENEFTFTRGKGTVLQNKFHNIHGIKRSKSNEFYKLIFTGTLAETTGVFRAIELAKKLRGIHPQIELKIIGRAAQKTILKKIINEVEKHTWITLVGGSDLVAHSQVIEAISKAHLGLICYPKNKSTEGAIPTKLYEYLSLQLPILLDHNELWESICQPYNASINIKYDSIQSEELWSQIQAHEFYTRVPESEFLWSSEVQKLLKVVKIIIS